MVVTWAAVTHVTELINKFISVICSHDWDIMGKIKTTLK